MFLGLLDLRVLRFYGLGFLGLWDLGVLRF